MYHYQERCQKCKAWLPAEPKGWRQIVFEPEGDEIIGYEYLWVCSNCGSGWGRESTTTPKMYRWMGPAKSNLYAGLRLVESGTEPSETAEPREPGSFEPEPVKDPKHWANAKRLTNEDARLIQAAWAYLKAIKGSDWLHEVHLVWALENALIDQDINVVKEATREYLDVAEGTVSSKDPRRWKRALAELREAYRDATK